MNVDSGLSIKNISLETAELILGNLEDKRMCIGLEKFYCSGVDCENLYTITNKQIGEPSSNGAVFETCLNEKCEFVAKNSIRNKNFAESHAVLEAEYQHKASLYGMAPRVRQVWVCKDTAIIIMDALYKTLGRLLKHLEYNQVQQYIEEYKKYLDFDETKISSLEDLLDIRYKIERKKGKLNQIEITIPDSEEQKQYKIDLINQAFSLIDRLHSLNISHGGTHLNNFMTDREGKLYFIDFGKSEYLNENRIKKDYNQFITYIGYIIKEGYTNLQYLLDYSKFKYKQYDFKLLKEIIRKKDEE